MKNTKTLSLLVVLLLTASTAFAQLEANLGIGYHTGAFKSSDPGPEMVIGTISGAEDNTEASNIYNSYGAGIPINFGLGIPINDNIMFNADFCYWLGSETTLGEVDVTVDIGGGNTIQNTMMATATSNQFRFNPGLTFSSDIGLYSRIALVIPLGGKTTFATEEETVGPGGTTFTKTKGESTGNFSIGASTAIGFAVELSDNMKLAFELQALALNIQSATQFLTSYEDSDGTKMDDIPVYFRETTFVDDLNSSSNIDDNPDVDYDKPMEELAGRSSFGAWGLNVKFIYVIGG